MWKARKGRWKATVTRWELQTGIPGKKGVYDQSPYTDYRERGILCEPEGRCGGL